MFPMDVDTRNLLSREHAERLRKAGAQPPRRVGLRRGGRDDAQALRPLLARALRAARV
jgi:hypothetical protein